MLVIKMIVFNHILCILGGLVLKSFKALIKYILISCVHTKFKIQNCMFIQVKFKNTFKYTNKHTK